MDTDRHFTEKPTARSTLYNSVGQEKAKRKLPAAGHEQELYIGTQKQQQSYPEGKQYGEANKQGESALSSRSFRGIVRGFVADTRLLLPSSRFGVGAESPRPGLLEPAATSHTT